MRWEPRRRGDDADREGEVRGAGGEAQGASLIKRNPL